VVQAVAGSNPVAHPSDSPEPCSRSVATLDSRLGRTEDIVLRYYEAFRRGDIDAVLEGWNPDGLLIPLGRRRSYRGHNELRRYLETDINEAPEFDFRIYTVLDQGDFAITFGRYSICEGEAVIDRGVFCISEVVDEKLVAWEAFEDIGDAFTEFRERVAAR
jgi:limonene-1,2-epoxide hydrolase